MKMRISQKGLKNLLRQLGKGELKEKVVKVHFRMYVTTGLIISVKLLFNYFFPSSNTNVVSSPMAEKVFARTLV